MGMKEIIKELDKLMEEGGDVGKLMDAMGIGVESEVESAAESEVEDVKKKHQPLDGDDDTTVAESGGSIDDEWDD